MSISFLPDIISQKEKLKSQAAQLEVEVSALRAEVKELNTQMPPDAKQVESFKALSDLDKKAESDSDFALAYYKAFKAQFEKVFLQRDGVYGDQKRFASDSEYETYVELFDAFIQRRLHIMQADATSKCPALPTEDMNATTLFLYHQNRLPIYKMLVSELETQKAFLLQSIQYFKMKLVSAADAKSAAAPCPPGGPSAAADLKAAAQKGLTPNERIQLEVLNAEREIRREIDDLIVVASELVKHYQPKFDRSAAFQQMRERVKSLNKDYVSAESKLFFADFVKKFGETFLPRSNASFTNDADYEAYRTTYATYIGVIRRLDGMTGTKEYELAITFLRHSIAFIKTQLLNQADYKAPPAQQAAAAGANPGSNVAAMFVHPPTAAAGVDKDESVALSAAKAAVSLAGKKQ